MTVAYLLACIPPIALLVYVYRLDRVEHEPVGLIVELFLTSAIAGTCAAAFIENVGGGLLSLTPIAGIPIVGDFLYFFLVVALVEEFCKRFPVTWRAWKHEDFDYRFDAVVYCVTTAIGFAVAENIMYVGAYGAEVAPWRLIPVHTICGVFMGYFLGCAKICERRGDAAACSAFRRKSLVVPVLIHGSWDFLVSTDSALLNLLALVGVVVLAAYAWKRLKLYASHDAPLPVRA